ncbi:L-serine ammonia-lyase [Actinomycetaceae bacterium L2_0104]
MSPSPLSSQPTSAGRKDSASLDARPLQDSESARPDTTSSAHKQTLEETKRAASEIRPLSVCEMFRVGIGPSSSHTVGPMRAGLHFAGQLAEVCRRNSAALKAGAPGSGAGPVSGADLCTVPSRIVIDLMGSLGATGRGHSTDRAILLGLSGFKPESVPVNVVDTLMERAMASGSLDLMEVGEVTFDYANDVRFLPGNILPFHVNALTITAFAAGGEALLEGTYYSIGGGFVMREVGDAASHPHVLPLESAAASVASKPAPFPYTTARGLLEQCASSGLSVSSLVMANEEALRPRDEVVAYVDNIWQVMEECIKEGCEASGTLPGVLRVKRRASELNAELERRGPSSDPLGGMDWVNLYALAVNEENAAGHRVVTAPTNGAAGVVPAVLSYYLRFVPGADVDGQRRFLLAAAAIGGLIKSNASIAGAEVGCQGEVGAASAMAAAGLAEAMGGTPQQVENAAEIAMEHSLGLTCDPVGGLVQIPCIERNAIAAVKAINAARMALWGDGRHAVSFDTVIETMRQTGMDMLSKYKETSRGGLAVNVVEC